jgi:hypothetical protein
MEIPEEKEPLPLPEDFEGIKFNRINKEPLPLPEGFDAFMYPGALLSPLPDEVRRHYEKVFLGNTNDRPQFIVKEEIDGEPILLTDQMIDASCGEAIIVQFSQRTLSASFIPRSIILSIHHYVKRDDWAKHLNYWVDQFNWAYVHE